jgi:hypothetical protein
MNEADAPSTMLAQSRAGRSRLKAKVGLGEATDEAGMDEAGMDVAFIHGVLVHPADARLRQDDAVRDPEDSTGRAADGALYRCLLATRIMQLASPAAVFLEPLDFGVAECTSESRTDIEMSL